MQRFRIPDLLNKLISEGVWPNEKWSTAQFTQQETDPIVGKEGTQKVSPDDNKIILMRPPFHTIADEVDHGNTFWVDYLTNYGEIDYSKAVIIADFGIGTDSPIILYYDDSEFPKVMYLKWSFSGDIQHSWVCTHNSFEEFANDTGLLDRLKG